MAARRTAAHVALPANRAYALDLVRSFDNENYLANLLHPKPPAARRAHAAIRAFNVELDRVRASVSNEDLARLRIAFFRDTINPLLAPVPDIPPSLPPVVDCLAEAVTAFPNADFSPLAALVDARSDFLNYPAFRTLPDLERFAAAPHRALLALHAAVLAPATASTKLHTPVDSAAAAVGLAIVLRAVPFHAKNRQSYMPRDNPSPSALLSPNPDSLPVFASVAEVANAHLARAEQGVRALESQLRPAFWPLIMARLYLGRLEAADNNPFDERLNVNLQTTWHLALQIRLLRARLFAR